MPLSKSDMAILGMLTVGPMSGYDMKQFCEQSLAYFWHESYGNLYPRLKRLAAAGLVRPRRERRRRAPDANVFTLTARGRATFRRWLHEPPEPERVRSELVLKLFFGAQAGPSCSHGMLRAYQREQSQVLERYGAIESMIREGLADSPAAPYWLLSLRRGRLLTEARLRWCEESLEVLATMGAEEMTS